MPLMYLFVLAGFLPGMIPGFLGTLTQGKENSWMLDKLLLSSTWGGKISLGNILYTIHWRKTRFFESIFTTFTTIFVTFYIKI